MFAIRRDVLGDKKIIWTTVDQEVLDNARAYVEYEMTLEPPRRLKQPSWQEIKAAADTAQQVLSQQQEGESTRASASASLSITLDKAIQTGKLAIGRLKGKYFDNLAKLEQWGLDTWVNKLGVISVRQPRYAKGWSAFYRAYCAKEETLEPVERIADPPLELMQSLSSDLAHYFQQRKSGRDRREAAVASRSNATLHLQGLLQLAALARMLLDYDDKVSSELQNWGYCVVAQKPRARWGSNKSSELEPALESSDGALPKGAPDGDDVGVEGDVDGADVAAGDASAAGDVDGADVAAGDASAAGDVDGADVAVGDASAAGDVDGADVAAGDASAAGDVDPA